MDQTLQNVLNYIEESRLVMTWIDFLDIAFIALFLSIGLVWLQKRASRSILFALVPLIITFVVAKSLKMYLTSTVFQFGLMALTISIVVIFQEDFRRTFETLATWRPWRREDLLSPGKLPDLLVECLISFSKLKTGALIVLQGRQSLEPYTRAGISVRGRVSIPLLQSIFDDHSPGHDGGVTIVDGLIDKLGVHLPLSRNTEETGRLGTRHAAALGLAEKCDALVLVVSEETGTVSIAQNGTLKSVKSAAAVRDVIRDHYKKFGPTPLHRSFFRVPWFRLAFSVVLSFGMWIAFARPTFLVQRNLEAPIVYRSLPKGWEAKPPNPLKVKLTLMGPEGPVVRLDSNDLAATVELSKVAEGLQRFVLSESNFSLPARVRVKRIEPSEIAVYAYPTVDFKVPVRISWTGDSTRAPSSTSFKIEPSRVALRVPKSNHPPQFLDTEPVDARELRRNGKLQVKLRLPQDVQMSELTAPMVEVQLVQPHN